MEGTGRTKRERRPPSDHLEVSPPHMLLARPGHREWEKEREWDREGEQGRVREATGETGSEKGEGSREGMRNRRMAIVAREGRPERV